MAIIPEFRCGAPDSWMQLGGREPRTERTHNLGQLLHMGQDGYRLNIAMRAWVKG